MKSKWLAWAGTFAMIFVAVALVLALGRMPLPAASAQDTAPTYVLTVSGQATVNAVPDEAVITAGVVTNAKTAQDAAEANAEVMNRVVAAVRREGVSDDHIRTSGYNLTPVYNYDDKTNPPPVVGFQASNNLSITVDDVSKAGAVLDAAIAAGATNAGGISFTIKDPEPLIQAALKQAVENARARADVLAKAAGVSIVGVRSIDSAINTPGPVPIYSVSAGAALKSPTPVIPGENTVTVNVTVVYEIGH